MYSCSKCSQNTIGRAHVTICVRDAGHGSALYFQTTGSESFSFPFSANVCSNRRMKVRLSVPHQRAGKALANTTSINVSVQVFAKEMPTQPSCLSLSCRLSSLAPFYVISHTKCSLDQGMICASFSNFVSHQDARIERINTKKVNILGIVFCVLET